MLKLETDIPNTTPGVPLKEFGEAKNDVVPGDNAGTPLIKKWLNDHYYAFYAILFKAGLVPSGVVEDTNTSQFFNALEILMNQHQSTDFFNPTPQSTPNNTVKLSKATVADPNDPTSTPINIAAGAADAKTFPGVTADSRIDRLTFDKTGTVFQILGVQAAGPVAPAIPVGQSPICRTLITTVGTPKLDNVADFIFDERVINRLPKLDLNDLPGNILLAGRVNANATINKTTAFLSGASFSSALFATGVYDITLSGISAKFANVHVIVTKNTNQSGSRASFVEGVTDKLSFTGFGTNVGFRVNMVDLFHDSCGGCPFMDASQSDEAWSFTVIGLD